MSEAMFMGPICFGKKVITGKCQQVIAYEPTACFCIAYKLRSVFIFFKWLEKLRIL